MDVLKLKRVFKFNEVELPDISSEKTPEEIFDFYSAKYPQLVNATITGPEKIDDSLVYSASSRVGEKG